MTRPPRTPRRCDAARRRSWPRWDSPIRSPRLARSDRATRGGGVAVIGLPSRPGPAGPGAACLLASACPGPCRTYSRSRLEEVCAARGHPERAERSTTTTSVPNGPRKHWHGHGPGPGGVARGLAWSAALPSLAVEAVVAIALVMRRSATSARDRRPGLRRGGARFLLAADGAPANRHAAADRHHAGRRDDCLPTLQPIPGRTTAGQRRGRDRAADDDDPRAGRRDRSFRIDPRDAGAGHRAEPPGRRRADGPAIGDPRPARHVSAARGRAGLRPTRAAAACRSSARTATTSSASSTPRTSSPGCWPPRAPRPGRGPARKLVRPATVHPREQGRRRIAHRVPDPARPARDRARRIRRRGRV